METENGAAVFACCHQRAPLSYSRFTNGSRGSKRETLFTWPNYPIWILSFLHSPRENSQENPTSIHPGSISAGIFRSGSEEEGVYLRLDAQGEILAHGYRGFEVLLALLAHELSPKMRWPGGGGKSTKMLHLVIPVYSMSCRASFSPVERWVNQ